MALPGQFLLVVHHHQKWKSGILYWAFDILWPGRQNLNFAKVCKSYSDMPNSFALNETVTKNLSKKCQISK